MTSNPNFVWNVPEEEKCMAKKDKAGTKTNALKAILVLVALWNALLSKRSGLVPLIIN